MKTTFTNPFARFIAMLPVAGAFVLVTSGLASAETPQSGAAKAQTPASKPNILFIIADDASHFGATGCSWVKTPNIDQLARQGLIFSNAYTTDAKCSPSRAAILTGRYPWQLESAADHGGFFPPNYEVFTEAMVKAGVAVGAEGKFWAPGIALTASGAPRKWGMDQTSRIVKSVTETDGSKFYFPTFLNERNRSKPFVYWFGSHYPHRPYAGNSGLRAGLKPESIDRVPPIWPDDPAVRNDMLSYAHFVDEFDKQVGGLIAALKASGEFNNTLVIVTSDNGMPFPRSKGNSYYISNHLPFIACWPNGIRNPGRTVNQLVSFVDIAPTFLDLLGIPQNSTGMAPITGHSFSDLLYSKPQLQRDFVFVGRERNDWGRPNLEGYPMRGIVKDNYMLILNVKPDRWPACNPEANYPDADDGPTKSLITKGRDNPALHHFWEMCFGMRPEAELYNIQSDPDCIKNLADDPASRDRRDAMKKLLMDQLTAQADPRMTGNGDIFDKYPSAMKGWAGKFEKLSGKSGKESGPKEEPSEN
jgi:arylsulfatase A-like enzyme